jgi:branched-chain amino acid transport system permease protein
MSDTLDTAPAATATPVAASARSPRRTARPPAMRGSPYIWLAVFLVAVALLRQYGDFGLADKDLINTWLFESALVVGFYFIFGVSGQFAFSQAAFAATGGYVSAWETREAIFGTNTFWVGMITGVVVTCIIALVFAYFMRKASEFYLAIATLGLSSIIITIINQWHDFTGTIAGTTSGIRPITIWGYSITSVTSLDNSYRPFWVWLTLFAIVMVIAIWVARSPVQRETIAMRDQQQVAASLGVPVLKHRITMFVLGSGIAAVAGAVFVHVKGFASPDDWGIDLGIAIFVILILGGIDSRWGPVIGAAFYVFIPKWLQGGVLTIPGISFTVKIFGAEHQFGDFKDVFFGSLLVLTMIVFPEGLVGIGRRIKAVTYGQVKPERRTWLSDLFGLTPRHKEVVPEGNGATKLPPVVPGEHGGEPQTRPVLEADNIAVNFGGVQAVDGVSLTLYDGEILGLVGPNGSGKTTFLNALTGIVDATGSVTVLGSRVQLGKPGRVRKFGILRTFQAPQTYAHLTCLEDVLLSTPDRTNSGLLSAWFVRWRLNHHERERFDAANAALARVGLADLAAEPTSRLPYGKRRLLELARAIYADPRALMLDEPSAGLNSAETDQLAGYLQQLKDDGVPILLVDHKLDFITSLCNRVAVLELGHLVAVGPAATVFADQRVVDAYLGVDEETEP